MNKHSLYYHNRLHDWYRQHSIMQEKQSCHHITDVLPPHLVEGTGQLTTDKLNFINKWCLDVNRTFFAVEKKASKSTPRHRQLKQSLCSKDFSKSTDLKPLRASDTATMTKKLNKNVKPLSKHTGLSTSTVVKAHRPCVGLADKRRFKQHSKKTGLSNLKTGKLDLCIINSTKEVKDDEDGTGFGHNFLTTRRSQLKQKENGNRSSAQFKTLNVSRSPVGNDNVYSYYGFISAVVRNVAQCNDNRRKSVNNFNDETPNPQLISSSEDSYTQHKLLPSMRENSLESRNETVSSQQTKKAEFEGKHESMSSFSFLQDGVCTDDNEITVTSVSCLDCTHPGNMEHVRNIDYSQSGRSVAENKQDKAPNQISDKENNLNLSTVLTENESIHSITGIMKDKINYTHSNAFTTQGQAEENKSTALESSANIGHDMKNVRLENNTNSWEDIKGSFQTSVKSENNSEGNTRGSYKQSEAMTEGDGKLLECGTMEDKLTGLCGLTNATPRPVSCCAASRCCEDGGESGTRSETTTIGHICLSNNLLNMLTIDDCKISQRYRLLKNSKSANEEEKTNKRIQDEVKEVTKKAITETRKDRRKLKPHLSQSIRANSAANRNNRTTLENTALSFHRIKSSTNFEKGFQALIQDKTPIEGGDQRKARDGRKVARAVKKTEGPIYRRLHAALRKQMEELRPNHCVKLQH